MDYFVIDNHKNTQRADIFVTNKYPQFARSALKGLFEREKVHINGKAAKAGNKLKLGDKLSVDTKLLFKEPKKLNLPVIYEDDDVIVINKPVGVLTHSKGALNLEPTVASFIRPKLNDKSLVGNRAGVIHRLDRATSGVIIVAKNTMALRSMQKQFSTRKVKKTYIAVAEGRLAEKQAIIDAPIARNPKKPQTFKASTSGKPSQTEYKVLKEFKKANKVYSMVELKPLTGRTHQLRVHLSYIGHPIVGDSVYGHGGETMLLHAKELELTLPHGQRKKFAAPLPDSFKDFQKP